MPSLDDTTFDKKQSQSEIARRKRIEDDLSEIHKKCKEYKSEEYPHP